MSSLLRDQKIRGPFVYVRRWWIFLFQEKARDDFRLKGWVGATETTFGPEWDKRHFIAYLLGGAVDRAAVNVFVQLRALSRGWSEAGRRFREMEACCEANSVSTARSMTIQRRGLRALSMAC